MTSHLTEVINDYAKHALRLICLAYKDLEKFEGGQNHSDIDEETGGVVIEQSNLTLIGIVGIKDIIRKEVPDAVSVC